MPFVKKNSLKEPYRPIDAHKIFIGRATELHFFKENILRLDEPLHNIISISGQGGVGKSTLLLRFIDDARATDFKDYCLTAYVDERQTTPASIMEKIAVQLRLEGDFEKALRQYKEVLRKLQYQREATREALISKTTANILGSVVNDVPFAGGILKEGTEAAANLLFDEIHYRQLLKDAERMEDPIGDLTRAFIKELNQLVETYVPVISTRSKQQRRAILFFDTFEQLAVEAAPWLLDYFLEAEVNNNVVLVIAGRDAIEKSTPHDPKRWLKYSDNGIIYPISLNSFTEDETKGYLAERGIKDTERIHTIWQLSGGLPLYLGFLTSDHQGKVDPTADVVANFLRWIPEQEQVKRRLALDAALFSRPFNQDELAAFPFILEDERPSLYRWLTGQPFVRSNFQDGRYRYHELAQELFSRHLLQIAPNECWATRHELANYYQQLLKKVTIQGNKVIYDTAQWLELTLALAFQLFFLPDELSHLKAIEQILYAFEYAKQHAEIARMLREVVKEQSKIQLDYVIQGIVKQLLQYIENNIESLEFLEAANYLLEKIVLASQFPTDLLATIYYNRGRCKHNLKDYPQALADYIQAIALKPDEASYYNRRGNIYYNLKDYPQALADYTQAITLKPDMALYYSNRGYTYNALKDYPQALADYTQAITLKPDEALYYSNRGNTYYNLKDYPQALADCTQAITLKPDVASYYDYRGHVYHKYKNFGQANIDYNHAIKLDPTLEYAYSDRGLSYLWLKDIKQAQTDYIHSWELDQTKIYRGFIAEWSSLCLGKSRLDIEQLEAMIIIDPHCYTAEICRAIIMWLKQNFEQALADIEKAILCEEEPWEAYFWKGMIEAFLERNEDALTSVEKALELGLPPILLTPLQWLEQYRLDFYEKQVIPLLARY